MKNLLLLHNRFTADDSDIWRVAIRRGWTTERTNMFQIKKHMEGYDNVRYYGNTLHAAQIEDQLPFELSPIDYSWLAKLKLYTKRNIEYIQYKDLIQPIQKEQFIKPARDKWFECKVFQIGETISGSPLADDMIYTSELVKFTDEVRCFVLDGEILTSSLYRIKTFPYDQSNENPEDINFDKRIKDTPIPQMVKMICSKVGNGLPRGVVIDFGYTENKKWSLIEFNEAWACGLYYCDPEKCFDVIIESQQYFKLIN